MLLKATIDPLTRAITLDAHEVLAMKEDFRVSGVKFTVPNAVGVDIGFKLSDSVVRIMYKTPALVNYYTPTDFVLNDTTATFSWIFDKNVTKAPGDVLFNVCGIITNNQQVITKEWHSAPAKIRIWDDIHVESLIPTQEERDQIAYLTQLVQSIYPGNTGSANQVLMKIGDGTQWKDPVTVTNTQSATNGTKIAEIKSGVSTLPIYAPAVTVTPKETSGTEIGSVKVGSTTKTLYAAVDSDELEAALNRVYGS